MNPQTNDKCSYGCLPLPTTHRNKYLLFPDNRRSPTTTHILCRAHGICILKKPHLIFRVGNKNSHTTIIQRVLSRNNPEMYLVKVWLRTKREFLWEQCWMLTVLCEDYASDWGHMPVTAHSNNKYRAQGPTHHVQIHTVNRGRFVLEPCEIWLLLYC